MNSHDLALNFIKIFCLKGSELFERSQFLHQTQIVINKSNKYSMGILANDNFFQEPVGSKGIL